jgi:hypothetical protein
MEPLLTSSQESITKKRLKICRSQLEISKKIIAFEELFALKKNGKSAREVAALLEVPNSTMQSWKSRKASQELFPEVIGFFSTVAGEELLQRIVMSVYQVTHFGSGGIRGLQEFLELSTLDRLVASSYGALQSFSIRSEEHIVVFGELEERKLAEKMKKRKITAGLDELFRGRHPCLVAIEVVSGFILLEKFAEDRTAETWSKELKPRLDGLNIELGQVVSDLCGGIRSSAKQLGATHIPEIFHAQYEISKATTGALASQEREFEKLVSEAEEKFNKAVYKSGEDSEKSQEAARLCKLRKLGFEHRQERRKKVRNAKKELGRIHHPIDISTGKVQTAEAMKEKFDDQFATIDEVAKEACLSGSCLKRIEKAKRAFDAIVDYLKVFFVFYRAFVEGLTLDSELEKYFNEVIFPLSYIKMIWSRLPKREKEALRKLREDLELKLSAPPYSEEMKKGLMVKGRECAEKFQRSSSCVEGRNGALSLYHHRFHRLSIRSLKALTVVHNFHKSQSDKTTAAQRFFGSEHENLFESLVKNVRIPGRPQQQHHDLNKRLLGRKKRLTAKMVTE